MGAAAAIPVAKSFRKLSKLLDEYFRGEIKAFGSGKADPASRAAVREEIEAVAKSLGVDTLELDFSRRLETAAVPADIDALMGHVVPFGRDLPFFAGILQFLYASIHGADNYAMKAESVLHTVRTGARRYFLDQGMPSETIPAALRKISSRFDDYFAAEGLSPTLRDGTEAAGREILSLEGGLITKLKAIEARIQAVTEYVRTGKAVFDAPTAHSIVWALDGVVRRVNEFGHYISAGRIPRLDMNNFLSIGQLRGALSHEVDKIFEHYGYVGQLFAQALRSTGVDYPSMLSDASLKLTMARIAAAKAERIAGEARAHQAQIALTAAKEKALQMGNELRGLAKVRGVSDSQKGLGLSALSRQKASGFNGGQNLADKEASIEILVGSQPMRTAVGRRIDVGRGSVEPLGQGRLKTGIVSDTKERSRGLLSLATSAYKHEQVVTSASPKTAESALNDILSSTATGKNGLAPDFVSITPEGVQNSGHGSISAIGARPGGLPIPAFMGGIVHMEQSGPTSAKLTMATPAMGWALTADVTVKQVDSHTVRVVEQGRSFGPGANIVAQKHMQYFNAGNRVKTN